MHCIPVQLRLWPLASSCELRGGQPGRTMIPKCPRARSVKPVFKRQARRSNPCHCTACLPYRLTYFRSARIQWQATLAVRQQRHDAAPIASPSTISLFDLTAYGYSRENRCQTLQSRIFVTSNGSDYTINEKPLMRPVTRVSSNEFNLRHRRWSKIICHDLIKYHVWILKGSLLKLQHQK